MTGPIETSAPTVPKDSALSPELAFLQGAGEDISDLRSELETMLSRREPEAAPPPMERPLQGTDRLPIREDGSIIEPQKAGDKPVTEPAPTTQATDKPTQEQALDPYAVDGTKAPAQDIADIEPGEVSIDAEGKLRDAKTGKYVPHQAMERERIRRKELEAELAKRDEMVARATERLNVLQEIMHGQEQKEQKAKETPVVPEPDIDPDVDIFGWAKQQKARADAAERRIAELDERNSKQLGELNAQQRYRQDITAFAAQNPDFFDGYKFIQSMRREELKAMGFTDEKQIASQIAAEERALVQNEFGRNGSPATVLYRLAQAKGYKSAPPPQAAQVQQPAPTQQTQAQAQPAPTNSGQQVLIPQVSQEGRDQVQRIANGVQASASLSGAGGSAGEGLTVEQIANMPEDAFDQLVAKVGRKNFDRLLGGK